MLPGFLFKIVYLLRTYFFTILYSSMNYKQPDRTAPRKRYKSTVIMDVTELRKFKKSNPEYQDMTLGEFNTIIREFNQNIIHEALENRDGVSLPEKIGYLSIMAFSKPKAKKIIDFGKSNKEGVVHYHANWDTDNKLGKIVFQNKSYNYSIENSRFWGLYPSRRFKLQMAAAFKKYWQKYVYVDNKRLTQIKV